MCNVEDMPLYMLVTKLSGNILANRKEEGEKWLKKVKEKVPNIKWVVHYAILGPYDFLDIFEANNEADAAKVSLLSREAGAIVAETWTAIPYVDFLDFIKDLD